MTREVPRARCLGCGYILDNLPKHRCPECGRDFSPLDPRTVDEGPLRPGRGVSVAQAVCALGPLFPVIAAVVLHAATTVIAGRSSGAGGGIVDGFAALLVVLLTVAAPVLWVASLCLVFGYAQRARHRTDWGWVVMRTALSIAAPVGALLFVHYNPLLP